MHKLNVYTTCNDLLMMENPLPYIIIVLVADDGDTFALFERSIL